MEHIPTVNLVLLVIVVGWLALGSKNWKGPVQAARLDAFEDDLRIVQGNVRRLDRDVNEWRRETNEILTSIGKNVESISRNGAKQESLDQIRVIEERILDVEQAIAAMPCGQVTKRATEEC